VGKHIFGYVNRLCDDMILVANPLTATIIEMNSRQNEQHF